MRWANFAFLINPDNQNSDSTAKTVCIEFKASMTKPEPPEQEIGDRLATALISIGEQTTALGLAIGCIFAHIAKTDPEGAADIAAQFQEFLTPARPEDWAPRSKNLLSMLFSALNEKDDSHG